MGRSPRTWGETGERPLPPRVDFHEQAAVAGETGGHCDRYKCRVDLIPPWFTAGIGWVFTYGSIKYPDTDERPNWQGGIRVSRLLASVERHMAAMRAGEDADPESGLPHWAHAATDLVMAEWMVLNRPDMDDREKAYPGAEEMLIELALAAEWGIRRVKVEVDGAEDRGGDAVGDR